MERKPNRIEIGGAAVLYFLDETADPAIVTFIHVMGRERGKGLARSLVREAKKQHSWLVLSAQPLEPDVDAERLIGFYESEGFRLLGDGSTVEWRRTPSPEKS